MFEVIIGEKGLSKSWQAEFPKITKCCKCKGEARIGFVVFESFKKGKTPEEQEFVCNLHENKGGSGGDYWLHDCCAVAVYFCKKCLNPTALYNQG